MRPHAYLEHSRGTYSSGINLLVYASAMEEIVLENNRLFFALESSLKHVDITYDKVMSDEHDLLGCCCYFGNHGGMTAAARKLSQKK